MRRMLLLAALLTSGATLLAAERATFIMTTGERVTGTLVARTYATDNVSRGSVLLNTEGRNLQIALRTVAVIDFVGGRPSTRELDDLMRTTGDSDRYDPYGQYRPSTTYSNNHVLVMRDGSMMNGTLRNILRGDTVRWMYEPGDIDDISIRDVARIYVNPDAARSAYANTNSGNYGGYGSYNPSAPRYPTYGGYGTLLSPAEGIPVDPVSEWTDTGINVRAGDMVSFAASGEVRWGEGGDQVASAAGKGDVRSNNYPVQSLPVGALIGKVGRGAPFGIGSSRTAIRMTTSGRLLLGVNDDHRPDNSGVFYVVIRRVQ